MRRRASGNFPSSIRLDHGDVLVMDGLAQSEYEHCTATELQGLRVNLTHRWVAQHTASCPLAGVVGCVAPNVCARFWSSQVPVGWGTGKINGPPLGDWSSFLLILVFVLLVGALINIRRRHRHTVVSVHPARWCTSPLGVVPVGSGDGVGDCHDVAILPRVRLFISLVYFLVGNKIYSFFKSIVFGFLLLLGILEAKWVPTPCYNDAYSVGTP